MITVSIHVTVDSLKTLKAAAAARAVEEGMTRADWKKTRKGPEDDLVMLLDPGSLPGCTIAETTTHTHQQGEL